AAAFKLKWFGGVGPSRMPDRHLRGPAPLSAGASMIVQADGSLIGVDPANGTERWQFDLPEKSMRYVTPFDSGYVCLSANGEDLFVAANQQIFQLNAFSGKREGSLKVRDSKMRWGYLSQGNRKLVATQMKPTAPRVSRDRKTQRNFVDQDYRSQRPLVCSRKTVVLDEDLAILWTRESKGLIPNGSISVDYPNGKIVFIEGRSQSCLQHPTDRIPVSNILERGFLVCLDLNNAKTLWEKEIQWPEGKDILYSQITPNGILLTTSQSVAGKARYYCRMFSIKNGDPIWSLEHDHVKGGLFHGEQVHHPVILRRPNHTHVLVMEPYFYDLTNGGKIIPFGNDENWAIRRPGHSCGTISGSGNCLFFRAGNPTVLNLNQSQENKFTALAPSRPGCWINIIPAGGRLLIPEASASCVCQYSLQTSMCFTPVSSSQLAQEFKILPNVLPKFQTDPFKPLHLWQFSQEKPAVAGQFSDRIGSLDLVPSGRTEVNRDGLQLQGSQWLTHQLGNPKTPKLPRTITLEVVARISESPEWCGLLGAIQDNGPHERGCLLGIHDDQLFFAVSSKGTSRVTYLTDPTRLEKNKKHHVLGTYDGSLMKLYVNGKQVNESRKQSGAIFYDPHSWLTVGAYKDNDELYIMKGSIQLAAVYQGTMLDRTIADRAQQWIPRIPKN
ncbi:MAG: LamG domain-containing protein, partial [Planctomycetota bacterium]|nr:LamG domain-containing protein [Planctomycetota bacterium]